MQLTQRIGGWLAALHEGGYNKDVARVHLGEDGVPSEMFDGPVDPEGWVVWKFLPSRVTDLDIEALETKYSLSLPNDVRAYLKAPCHMIDQVNNGKHLTFLPHLPADQPLGPYSKLLDGWSALVLMGFLPIAEFEDGWGPICVDLDSEEPYEVFWIDHEELGSLDLSHSSRVDVLSFRKPLYSSLEEFYGTVLSPRGKMAKRKESI